MFSPVALIQAIDANVFSARRRVYEAPATDVDSDVGKLSAFLIEENQVTDAQGFRSDGQACPELRPCRAGNGDTGVCKTVVDETAAIETAR